MKAEILEAKLSLNFDELSAVILPERERRMATADTEFPMFVVVDDFIRKVEVELYHGNASEFYLYLNFSIENPICMSKKPLKW